MQRNPERIVVLVGGLLIALLVISSAITYRNTTQLDDDARSVAHTHEVRNTIEGMLLALVNAESGQRAFIITGDESLLEPYNVATADFNRRLQKLKELTRDNPRQQERIPKLVELSTARLDKLAEVIAARRRSWDEAKSFIANRVGTQQMEAIRELVATMDRAEATLLAERRTNRERAYWVAIVSGFLTSLVGLILVAAASQTLIRSMRGQAQAAARLHEQRELLRATLSSIGDCVIATDTHAIVTFMNRVAEKLTAWPARDALGQPLESVFHIINEETRQSVENPALRALKEGAIVGLANHTVLIDRNGVEHAIEDSAGPIRDTEGNVSGAVLVFRDVSQEREIDRALQERVTLSALETDILTLLIRPDTLSGMLAGSAGTLAQYFPESGARIWLFDTARQNLELRADAGVFEKLPPERTHITLGQLEVGMIAESRAPVVIDSLTTKDDWSQPGNDSPPRSIAFAGYPMMVENRLVGVMAVVAPRPFSEAQQRALLVIAHALSVGVERKRAEERLFEARELLNSALAAGRIGTFIWDYTADALQFDSWKRELYALRPDQVVNRLEHFLDLVHEDDRAKVEQSFRRCAAEGDVLDVEFRVVGGDGVERWFINRGRALVKADEGSTVLVGACVDITAQKDAQHVVRESERRFRALADSIPHLAWMARPDGNIFWYNQRWYDYTGTKFDQVQGWGWQIVHDPRELPRVLEKLKHSFATGEPWEDVFPLRRRDGRFRWHLSRMMPIHDDKGNVVLWFGTNTDITEQREAAAALREADNRKDEFLAMIGHELRNPLAGIVSGVHVLRMLPSSPEADEMEAVIERQAAHMSRIVDDLLDTSRMARGKLTLRREKLELRELIDRTIHDYRNAHQLQDCALDVKLPEQEVWVLGDRTRLSQVFTNVTHNACKFCDGPNDVTVTLEVDNASQLARVSIADRGIGMTQETLSRIFEPFHQADTSLDRSLGGLGLGLALVKGIVDLHEGTITASSEGLGRGTRVEIELPLTSKPVDHVESPLPTDGAPKVSRKVLLVDDRRDAILPLERMLSMAGHKVMTAPDGPSGLALAKEFLPEVVLCDIGLTGPMSGYDVAEAARGMPELAGTYLVAITGYGQDEDRREAQRVGFDYHVTKPVSRDQLFDLVEHMPRFNQTAT